eukprot:5935868-Amphidinium_carterae.1
MHDSTQWALLRSHFATNTVGQPTDYFGDAMEAGLDDRVYTESTSSTSRTSSTLRTYQVTHQTTTTYVYNR